MRRSATGLLVTCAIGLLWTLLVATAQPAGKVWRLGILGFGAAPSAAELRQIPFWQAMRELGWVEGQNITVERRYAEGHRERLPDLADELVRLKVDVMVASGGPVVLVAKNATQTIPIVMLGVFDPVEQGLVASLARPGGNVTGLTTGTGPEIWGKRVALLKEAVPSISRVGFLYHARNPFAANRATVNDMQTATQALGLTLQDLGVREIDELDSVLAAMSKEPDGALISTGEPFFFPHRSSITDLVAKHGLPAIYEVREFVDAGGLMSYGPSLPDAWRRAAYFVDRILKGAKPADLPVERPMKFELVLNLKAARALRLTIPPVVLFQADEVIR